MCSIISDPSRYTITLTARTKLFISGFAHGGLAGTGPLTPTPPPSRNLVRKCRTMGAKGTLSKICLI